MWAMWREAPQARPMKHGVIWSADTTRLKDLVEHVGLLPSMPFGRRSLKMRSAALMSSSKGDWSKILVANFATMRKKLAATYSFTAPTLHSLDFHSQTSWDVGWAKSNSDGAFSPGRAGYRALLRDNKGSFIEGIAVHCPRASINILELKGFYGGIKIALKHRQTRLWLEGDSNTAVAWINSTGSPPWQAVRPLSAICHALSSFSLWKASHICREANQLADLLAALRDQDREEIISPGVIWNDFQTLVRTDAEGHPYPRIK
ncbi:hypothetical protein QJS10_CPB17g00725 [Acorus calamus]|uniref:RNase H type-1 domain-containing protein n=1 Tax=Acorus calamus TaxID=4465 RepID=A0AAV9CY78_ACOCL|nr:hypothetical protein QJS10_CPB17g00725 [Acorus calamus]